MRHRVRFIRFPFAKENHEVHSNNASRVRSVAAELGAKVNLIADLPGGKPRLSNEKPIQVESGQTLKIALNSTEKNHDLYVTPVLEYPATSGDVIAIGDGELEFIINRVENQIVFGEFLRSGLLERRRAFIPRGVNYKFDSFTKTDKEHAKAAFTSGFDAIAVSFTTKKQDIIDIRRWLNDILNWDPKIIAKIETTEGAMAANEIASEVDAIIVGRGDLLLESSPGALWKLQSIVLRACQSEGIPGFVGTGMLESMQQKPYPTRAEIIDYSTAAEMGAAGVLFSAETTIGNNPIAVLDMAEKINSGW